MIKMFKKEEQAIMAENVKTSSTHEEMETLNNLKGTIVTILDKSFDEDSNEMKYEIEETDFYILERYLLKKHNFTSIFNKLEGDNK